ncbi:RluA family pseudouridine synthase, partial [Flavonifractor plautii]
MVQQSPRRLELTVTADQAGEKIDTLLRRELRLSGTVIRRVKWLDDGILLDGMRVTTACRPAAGQVLSVRVADPDGQGDMVPTPGPLDIVYEDGDLLVLNKAPGVLIHPGPGHYSDTLCNYIAWYYKKAGIAADVHPVQRLDKG